MSGVEIQAAGDFLKAFGFPIFMLLLGLYLTLRPRTEKDATGRSVQRSPLLVPGKVYDDALDEVEAVRSYYQATALAYKADCEARINEYREQAKIEQAERAALQVRFDGVNKVYESQVALLVELRNELRESRRRSQVTADRAVDEVAEMMDRPGPKRHKTR